MRRSVGHGRRAAPDLRWPELRQKLDCQATEPFITVEVSANKPLTVCCRTKVVAVCCMTAHVLQRVRTNRDGERLQCFRLRFNCAFGAHHSGDIVFE